MPKLSIRPTKTIMRTKNKPSIGLQETLAISKLEDDNATFLSNTLPPAPYLPASRTRYEHLVVYEPCKDRTY
ncbi:hypothetical protein DL764_007604 [Monosporascus ibericus]|uniref:Uncharacterized protein n=1 Tax=Monosporascus ibericus TaxID=155417 RepID=A0A4Q4T353_9PEZI|nr:hypothetical protein DL764_007604 [Monosporascus ibericus]